MEEVIAAVPELSVDLEDDTLVNYINAWIKRAESKETELNLKEKRERNVRFFFGRQVDAEARAYKGGTGDRPLKSYEKPFIDNAIKEGEDILRPILLSRLPDMIVTPGNLDNEFSVASAKQLSDVVNNALTTRDMRKVLTKAVRHLPLYYTGVIKYRWDPNKGKFGDIVYEAIHPENILVDYTATENNERSMKIIVHYVEKPLGDWILMFPGREEELKKYAQGKGKITDAMGAEDALAVNLRLPEVWFEYKRREEVQEEAVKEDPEEQNNNEEEKPIKVLSGVVWYAGDTVLDKRMNPNWDWEGQEQLFFEGQPVPTEVLEQMLAAGIDPESLGITREKTYRNFFGRPRKPFIFLGYEQYGQMPLDEISRIEENISIQENYDHRNMRITHMIDVANGKNVWSSMSGLKRGTVEKQDFDNPNQDMFVEGSLRDVHEFIKKEQPSAQMFNDLARSHDRILSRLHVHGATRGEVQSDTATTNQIAREADFTVVDDMAENTINEAATQMAEALLHMMKLRYTPEHFKLILGAKGEETYFRFKNDMIEDGMEVTILASGTDKLKAERNAKEEAGLGLIDPLSYYEAIGHKNADERAERLFLQQTAPELYYEKVIKGNDVPDIATHIMQASQQRLQLAGAGQPAQQVQPQTNPQLPSAQNPTNIPTTPQGSSRGLMQQAGSAIQGGLSRVFGR